MDNLYAFSWNHHGMSVNPVNNYTAYFNSTKHLNTANNIFVHRYFDGIYQNKLPDKIVHFVKQFKAKHTAQENLHQIKSER